jgi:hypothetical protein
MRAAPTLVLAPMLALVDQSVAYAFVPWGCAHQHALGIDAVHAVFLAATLLLAARSWRDLRAATAAAAAAGVEGWPGDRRMIARIGLLAGLLSALVIAAMWIPHWAISPCFTP